MQDVTISALHAALRGLSARQRVIADNVANIETPGFTAGRVDFESSLAAALSEGHDPLTTSSPIFSRSNDEAMPNGNNVRLDEEMLAGTETNLRYQLITNAMSDKFRLLRSVIRGQ